MMDVSKLVLDEMLTPERIATAKEMRKHDDATKVPMGHVSSMTH